ncbi:PepSY domain-containing protein [Paracoccus sp. PAR01]|uniref:PepSY domain-containing protein n=1 Tax=Paracoccus sp. PAR01 TaxID=2769282 RepID=UPI0017835657|nr:PepSY domain-containing protein [Paracoccus sp. PAR01]MBD9527754.1 PepSY domain-containing protein [Paracoccus sp. PAR01]
MIRITLLSALAAVPLAANAAPIRPLSASVTDFERRGYIVRSAEDDGRTHEIEAIAPDGRRIEAVIEAATGEVLTERPDD